MSGNLEEVEDGVIGFRADRPRAGRDINLSLELSFEGLNEQCCSYEQQQGVRESHVSNNELCHDAYLIRK